MDTENIGIIGQLATVIGAQENALRLLLSLFIGYPFAFVHRYYLYKKSPNIQHLFFTACGLLICYFNFGSQTIHSIVNIVLIYTLLLVAGGTQLSVILSIIINTVYLSVGYYLNMSSDYIISWTTPHCVLTLRLIGLVFDIYDGKKKQESLSKEQQETALRKIPSLLEVAGYTYFFGGFLVGPQFPLKRYQDFVNGAFCDTVTGGLPHSVAPAMKRLSAGLAYTLVFQVTSIYFPDSYLTSPELEEMSFLSRLVFVLLWGKFAICKYIACWLITEGACILTGLTYNGKDENGNDLWDGCANVNIQSFETATDASDLVSSFNINTNKWMGKYIFKRLKFMGNKNISQLVTLFYLALWHGLFTGYFMNFFIEFLMVTFEKGVQVITSRSALYASLRGLPMASVVVFIIKKIYCQFFLSYALVSFCLLSYDKYMKVYWSLWMVGHVWLMGWPLVLPFLLQYFRKPKAENQPNKDIKTE